MRKSRFTEEQIVIALRQAEAGTPVADTCRKREITETTFYLEEEAWRSRSERAARVDFIDDTLLDGTTARILSVVDHFIQECVALVLQSYFRGDDVAAEQAAVAASGRPAVITVDNGIEFMSKLLNGWAYWNGVQSAGEAGR